MHSNLGFYLVHLLGKTRTMRYVTTEETKEWIHCP